MRKQKRDPMKVVVRWTVILIVVAVAASLVGSGITAYRKNLLATKQNEAQEINEERDRQYAVDLAEFERASASGANLAWPAQKTEGWDIIDLTNYPLENPGSITMTRQDTMYSGMLLVNQWHSRPDDFDDSGVTSVGSYTGGKIGVANYNIKLFPVAISALQDAVSAANEAGYSHYMVSEGYRSWDDQNTLFQKALDRLKNNYSGDALIERAKKDVNYPGTSEFNSGLAFTLRLYSRTDASIGKPAYSTTEAGQWMNENCWKYGLVFRFPLSDFPLKGTADKSYKTGITAQLNLYRYVGKGNAAVMHVLDYCMEEYIEYLQEHPHIAVFEDGTLRYEIYRQYVGDDAESFTVPTMSRASDYTVSLDNMGGVIIVYEY